jgi:hypothetical protein
MAKRFSVSGFAADATRSSGSVHIVIVGNATAAPLAARKPDSGNDAVPTTATSRLWKDGWTIATASRNIVDAGPESA